MICSACKYDGPNWIKFSSLNKKQCTQCGNRMDWDLSPDQAPLVSNNRMISEGSVRKANREEAEKYISKHGMCGLLNYIYGPTL